MVGNERNTDPAGDAGVIPQTVPATRRIGAEGSETRARIVAATEQVLRDEGYAAASTRRVAIVAGLKPSLVHYYFPTTEDLLLAVFRRGAAVSDAMIEDALASPDPVRALWRFFADTSRTGLTMEFMALAIHREAIREEIVRHSHAMRERQAKLFETLLGEKLDAIGAPAGISVIMAGIGRALVMEGGLGISAGHAEAHAMVEAWLDRLLPDTSEAASILTSASNNAEH